MPGGEKPCFSRGSISLFCGLKPGLEIVLLLMQVLFLYKQRFYTQTDLVGGRSWIKVWALCASPVNFGQRPVDTVGIYPRKSGDSLLAYAETGKNFTEQFIAANGPGNFTEGFLALPQVVSQ